MPPRLSRLQMRGRVALYWTWLALGAVVNGRAGPHLSV